MFMVPHLQENHADYLAWKRSKFKPSIVAGIATGIIFDFLLALVLVEDPSQRTMAGALGAFQGHYATDIPLLSAGTMVILLPTLLLFVIFQRQVISALLQGSVKG